MITTSPANDVPAPAGLRGQWLRFRRALERHTLSEIIGGVWLARHFNSRSPVIWAGGFPSPHITNRGRLETQGCTLFSGVRIEVARNASLSIGKGTMINRDTYIVCHEQVSIGRGCLISWDVVIMDDDQHERSGLVSRRGPIVIEDDAWIGCRAIIMKGVTIGRGAVVGAGAIVTRDVPPETLVAGQPARVVRSLVQVPPDLAEHVSASAEERTVEERTADDLTAEAPQAPDEHGVVGGGRYLDSDSTVTRPHAGML